jgi:hypothetical protein
MTAPDEIDIDTSQIVEHPPDTDIDQYVEEANFRIERMGSDGVWICAYTNDPDEPDHHYDLSFNVSFHVTHRKEDMERNIK